ncbi:MAG: hypothetical protein KatS3mg112_1020 [Thermogutta sp.]|nr:MAG: hypothetical protein KatS3mg112_1020 [Thermogutta sp.]
MPSFARDGGPGGRFSNGVAPLTSHRSRAAPVGHLSIPLAYCTLSVSKSQPWHMTWRFLVAQFFGWNVNRGSGGQGNLAEMAWYQGALKFRSVIVKDGSQV